MWENNEYLVSRTTDRKFKCAQIAKDLKYIAIAEFKDGLAFVIQAVTASLACGGLVIKAKTA